MDNDCGQPITFIPKFVKCRFFLLFLSFVPQFIVPVATTRNTKQDVIDVSYITVEVSNYRKGEIIHSGGKKVFKSIIQYPLMYS